MYTITFRAGDSRAPSYPGHPVSQLLLGGTRIQIGFWLGEEENATKCTLYAIPLRQ